MEAFLWAGAIIGLTGGTLGIVLNLHQLSALFPRGKCVISSSFHGPEDLVGFSSKPRFLIEFENKGAVPLDFRHFELLLPRLEGVRTEDGGYVGHPGAELFKDGVELGSRLKARQEFRKIDFLTRTVRVEPHTSEIEFFELDAFLPDPPPEGWTIQTQLPSDFEPVLQFQQGTGREFHCDAEGIHPGPYRWPFEKDLAAVRRARPAKVVELCRSRLLRRWSVQQRDADIGQLPDVKREDR